MHRHMKKLFARFLKNEDGPTTVEYAVMLALILASIIAAVGSVGVGTGGMYSNIQSEMEANGF